jgi:hypothetical protein
MISEGASKNIGPSPEEAELIRKVTQEADPTTYSEVAFAEGEEKKDLGKAAEGYENQLVSSRGEKYVKLGHGESDSSQFVTAKLLKGILNVSDIIKDEKGEFYSKVMPIDKIQEETSDAEIEGDFFVIRALTGDGDHDFTPASENLKGGAKNIIREDGKAVHFDFGYSRELNPAINNAEQAKYTGTEALQLADKKLDAIYKRLNGTMGTLFLKSVMKESGLGVKDVFPNFNEVDESEDSDILAIQAALLNKVHEARSEVNKRMSAQLDRAA